MGNVAQEEGKSLVRGATHWELRVGDLRTRCVRRAGQYVVQYLSAERWRDFDNMKGDEPLLLLQKLVASNGLRDYASMASSSLLSL